MFLLWRTPLDEIKLVKLFPSTILLCIYYTTHGVSYEPYVYSWGLELIFDGIKLGRIEKKLASSSLWGPSRSNKVKRKIENLLMDVHVGSE